MKTSIVQKNLLYSILFLSFLFIGLTPQTKAAEMQRLYNPNTGQHFYTKSTRERNHLVNAGWKYEGVAWQSPDKGIAVYRLYNKNTGDHFYTKDKNERNNLYKKGWDYEGVSWYSDQNQEVPLYRIYNPNGKIGAHHYTTDKSEHSNLIRSGWRDEGVAWYGITADSPENADKSALKQLIELAETIKQTSYTKDSWANFQKKLQAALYAHASNYSTQADIDRALQELKNAKDQLKPLYSGELDRQDYADVINNYLFKLINDYRVSKGKSKLIWDSTAAKGSNIRAQEAIDLWTHTRPNGSSWHTAIPSNDSKYKSTSEILGQIYYSDLKLTKEEAYRNAKIQLDNWKNSSQHKAIILHSPNKQQWASIGTAYSQKGYMVCQFFIEY